MKQDVTDVIFKPLQFRNLQVKNRIFRSSVTGRWDNYDGSGNQARINWENKFAKGGVGAIISSYVPVSREGQITPQVATIDEDSTIPFWSTVAKTVHQHDGCKYILQLSHSGRQRDFRKRVDFQQWRRCQPDGHQRCDAQRHGGHRGR